MAVRKTTVYLEPEEAEALRALATASGRSQAELIRQGVRLVVGLQPQRVFHSRGVGAGDGSTDPDRFEIDPDELYDVVMGRRTWDEIRGDS